jgi:L-fucose isomerase-like protein
MKSKADTRDLDAVSIKCVFGTAPILGFSPCLAQTLLANKDLSVICECDAYGLITNLILNSITGKTSAFMEHYEVVDDGILVGVCGFIPRDFVDGDVKIRSSNLGDSLAGVANVSKVKTGQVTFGRFFEEQGAFKLFLTRAEAVAPPKWTELGWDEPTPDFPSLLLKLEMPVDRYIEKVPGQHIVMTFGDHVSDIKKLCKLLGIEVIE